MIKVLLWIVALILLAAFVVAIVRSAAAGPKVTRQDGVIYKYVEIDGRRFIASRTHNGYWVLAGPLESK